MGSKKRFRLRIVGVAILFLVCAGISCGGGEAPTPPPQSPGGGERSPSPEPQPDLVVSAIEVFPTEPQAGQRFGLNVYVRNVGQASSGEYDLAIFIEDVSRGSRYPVGTFRVSGLQPGENVAAYSADDLMVNDPGSYQVHVEIRPFLFEDGDPQNNTLIWSFTAR